jgi:hypothetical protein
MTRLCVHLLPNRFSKDCVICGMRVDTIARGVSTTSGTEQRSKSRMISRGPIRAPRRR